MSTHYVFKSEEDLQKSEIGRQLAALRPVKIQTCSFCSKQMLGTSRRQYCTTSCNKKAYYQRHKPASG